MIRTAVLTALATLAIAAPAAAADNLCHGQLAPPTPEQELQHHIEFAMELRAENGLRADEAYVRSLVEQGLPESDVIVGPVTPGEERYLKIRENLGLGRRAIHYLEQRPGLSGGSSITDRFPRKPLLVLHLTRNRATHQAALKRLVPRPRLFRTEKVRYSEHSLDRITRQIYRDRKKLRKAGSRSATPRRTPPRTASTSRSSRREPTTPSTSRTATGRSSPNARAPSSPSSCASRPASSGSRPTAGRCASPGSRRTPTRSRSASRSPSSTIASSSASSSASRPRSTPMAAARRSTRDR